MINEPPNYHFPPAPSWSESVTYSPIVLIESEDGMEKFVINLNRLIRISTAGPKCQLDHGWKSEIVMSDGAFYSKMTIDEIYDQINPPDEEAER